MSMLITNQTIQDYWFGPLHLPAGIGTGQLTVDDTSATSLYLNDDSVADAINTLWAVSPALITVTGAAPPFPRATGVPAVLHGDGSPEGIVYAGQGSIYLRRDNSGGTQLYQKTTGIHLNTGWVSPSAAVAPTGTLSSYGGASAPSGYLLCDGSAVSRATYADLFGVLGVAFGSGDGSTTFNVPDMRGRVPAGYAASGGHVDVSTLGNNDGQAAANRRPKHRTSNALTGGTTSGPSTAIWEAGTGTRGNGSVGGTDGETATHTHTFPAPGGSIGTNVGTDALDTASYLVLNYIVKT
jgi:microcystin-dependent protein